MDWPGTIFKFGSSGQQRQFTRDRDMVFHAPTRTRDHWSRAEIEALDHAIEPWLGEGLKKPNEYRRRTENDEELARALHESLHITPHHPYALPPQNTKRHRLCGGCNREIGNENYLSTMGTFWHPECFCCHACGGPITEGQFSLSGMNPYHKRCFKDLNHPKCDVCHQFIPTNGAGFIKHLYLPFWNQKCCPSHEHDNTASCCSCRRWESWNARHISLGDGRSLCLECMESAMLDTGGCQPLYHAARDFYEGINMKIDQEIPLLLVESQALNEANKGKINGQYQMPETRGLCLSEEQIVTTIVKGPYIQGNRLVGVKKYSQKLTRKCEVIAILVLYGLPSLEVEEGICQMLSYMWLESEVMPGSRSMPSTYTASSSSLKSRISDREKKLVEFFMHEIEHDNSASGKGFKAANAAVRKYGLRRMLDHIHLRGNFPF